MELMSRYATNFAIVDNGIVTSTIWGSIYNASDFPNAVRIDDLAVQAGTPTTANASIIAERSCARSRRNWRTCEALWRFWG